MGGRGVSGCGCQPGVEAGGWHEIRSERCLAEELAAWDGIMERVLCLAFPAPGPDTERTES